MYKRPQYDTLFRRLGEPRRFIQVLAGPRQVGKSTLIGQLAAVWATPITSVAADGQPATRTEWIAETWESVRSHMSMHGQQEHLLVIDEIQKLDNWSETVKAEWDRDTREGRNLKVILLGSSRLLLKKGLSESLAGRFELIRMPHWSYNEMRDAFGWSLEQYIYFGGYPGCAAMTDDEERWRSYVLDAIIDPAINRDVLQTTTIYKPALLRQLFELGCAYSGELLSLNKALGQLTDAGNVTTLSSYLTVLDECNLLCGLQKYAQDEARRYNSIPKYQVYNSALHTVQTAKGFAATRLDPKAWGRWVESAVGAYLLNQADLCGYKLFYWRDKSDEVDFVLSKNRQTVGIEVKSGRRTAGNGMSRFRERYRPLRTLIVGTGGVSVEDFLLTDLRTLF